MVIEKLVWVTPAHIVPVAVDMDNFDWLKDIGQYTRRKKVSDVLPSLYTFIKDAALLVETDEEYIHFNFMKGFTYDRASVPFTLGSIRSDHPSATIASLVHDVMYILPADIHKFTPREVHQFLKQIMLLQGASRFTAWKYWAAVVIATPFNYQKHRSDWDEYMKDYVTIERKKK
jgi:hypothetical protein